MNKLKAYFEICLHNGIRERVPLSETFFHEEFSGFDDCVSY